MAPNEEQENIKRVKEFIAYARKNKNSLTNELLFDEFISYLAAVDPIETLSEVPHGVLCELRKVLYDGGVYIPASTTANQLVDHIVTTFKNCPEIPEWPPNRVNPVANSTPGISTPEHTPLTVKSHVPPLLTNQKLISDFARAYDDQLKYSGRMDSLDACYQTFTRKCDIIQADHAQRAMLFHCMLKGDALEHYFMHTAFTTMTTDQLYHAFYTRFETFEKRMVCTQNWEGINLTMTMAKHPEKTMYDCFELIKDELQRLRKNLGPSANDEMMRMKLIRACERVSACNYIAIRPPESLEALVNDLRAATSSYDRLHPDRASEVMMTDRKYFNHRRQGNSHTNTQTEHSKECRVCHKTGCWSTNHSVDERIKAYNEYREKQRHRRSQSPKTFMVELQELIFDLELEPDAFVLTNQKAQNPDDELLGHMWPP